MKKFKGMLISSLAITTFAGVGTTFVTNTVYAANDDSSKIQVRSNKSINTTLARDCLYYQSILMMNLDFQDRDILKRHL